MWLISTLVQFILPGERRSGEDSKAPWRSFDQSLGHNNSNILSWKPQLDHIHLLPRYKNHSPPPFFQAGLSVIADHCNRLKVKQAIGQANILPWSNIWKKSHTLAKGKREDDIKYKSPQGGLIAHWVMSVVFISAGSGIDAMTESILLPGYFQIYAHAFILRESELTPSLSCLKARKSHNHEELKELMSSTQ